MSFSYYCQMASYGSTVDILSDLTQEMYGNCILASGVCIYFLVEVQNRCISSVLMHQHLLGAIFTRESLTTPKDTLKTAEDCFTWKVDFNH